MRKRRFLIYSETSARGGAQKAAADTEGPSFRRGSDWGLWEPRGHPQPSLAQFPLTDVAWPGPGQLLAPEAILFHGRGREPNPRLQVHGNLSGALSSKYYYHPHFKDRTLRLRKGKPWPRPDSKGHAPNTRAGRGCRGLRNLNITVWVSLS